MGSGRPDLGSDRPDWGSERPILRPRRLFSRLRGGTDGRTDGRTETGKFALYGIIGHRPLRGRCPKRDNERIHWLITYVGLQHQG